MKEHRSLRSENYSEHLPPSRPAYFLIGPHLQQTNGEVEEEATKVVLNFVIYLYMYALDKPYEILLSNFKDAEIYSSPTNYTYYLAHSSST